jgi:WD40 repeat protein
MSAKPIVRRVTRRDAQALCFSPDSRLLALGEGSPGQRMVLHLWDLTNACEQPAPPARIGWLIHVLAFYPDGKRLSVVSPERTYDVWDVTTGRMAFSLRPESELTAFQSVVALSSDGCWFAAQAERAVTVWDSQTRQPLFTSPEERTMPWSLAWNPSRNLLAVGTSDGGLVLWNIPMVRRQLADLGLDW